MEFHPMQILTFFFRNDMMFLVFVLSASTCCVESLLWCKGPSQWSMLMWIICILVLYTYSVLFWMWMWLVAANLLLHLPTPSLLMHETTCKYVHFYARMRIHLYVFLLYIFVYVLLCCCTFFFMEWRVTWVIITAPHGQISACCICIISIHVHPLLLSDVHIMHWHIIFWSILVNPGEVLIWPHNAWPIDLDWYPLLPSLVSPYSPENPRSIPMEWLQFTMHEYYRRVKFKL